MIPIYVKQKSASSPPDGTHYVVARNGLFVHKKMGWVDAVVPVEDINLLEMETPLAQLLLPSLPAEILVKFLKLAKAVYDSSQSEVGALLHYSKDLGYELTVPKQQVCPDGINYESSRRLPNTLCVGTVHSHGSFGACHSQTDHDDEEYLDGVHITLGDIGEYPEFSLSAEFVVNGFRFPVEPEWFQGLISKRGLYHLDLLLLESYELPEGWTQVVQPMK